MPAPQKKKSTAKIKAAPVARSRRVSAKAPAKAKPVKKVVTKAKTKAHLVKAKAPAKAARAKDSAKVPKAKASKQVVVKAKAAAKAKAPARAKPAPLASAVPQPSAASAPAASPKIPVADLPPALVAAVKALDDKKASDIRILQLGALSSVADYYILATGTSEPHLRALRIELDRALSEAGSRVRGIEAQSDSGWVVVDAFDMLFHLFRPETRAAFRLETLWKDGRDIPVHGILAA
jgi:ribosome-associated protein